MILRIPLIFSRNASTRAPYRKRKPTPGASPQPPSVPSGIATHFRVTLHRSAIGLPSRIAKTLEALGIRRRMQTIFHRHSPDIAGKILKVKELVEVENVGKHEVQTAAQMRAERKAVRGYEVVQRRNPSGFLTFKQAASQRNAATPATS
ncbi:hypothetical protein BS47DRAFT_1087972 [Hydnum rufescens UP504]|uniref:Large ribosomal subunit protein uL30m n=1 Tax=Hydnum rufescens UP504 TaxID=1448309 RepID=A0A9P6DV62_9AGAM|nr:hypothetical protein BS47DRAFT_1087972 [Hydnum rufescens UP504]